MTQTMKDHNNSAQKRNRPGQRKQERLQRLARRRRRQQITLSILVAAIVIVLAAVAFWQYQVYTTRQHDLAAAAAAKATATASARASATANAQATVNAQASATALAQAVRTATSGSPIPSTGPASPPAASGTPTKLADGLQYIDIKMGSGPVAQQGSTVQIEYTGWLASNSKKFDSSYDHGGQPFAVTPLGKASVIPGLNEGLVGARAGGTRRLILPAALAYGAQGSPPVIPPNATLIFDITVISVQ